MNFSKISFILKIRDLILYNFFMNSNNVLNLQQETASDCVELSGALPSKDDTSTGETVQPTATLPTAPPQSIDTAVVALAEGVPDDEEEEEDEPNLADDAGDEGIREGEEVDEEGWVGEHNLQEALARCASGDLSNAPSQSGGDAELPTVASLTSDFAMQVGTHCTYPFMWLVLMHEPCGFRSSC